MRNNNDKKKAFLILLAQKEWNKWWNNSYVPSNYTKKKVLLHKTRPYTAASLKKKFLWLLKHREEKRKKFSWSIKYFQSWSLRGLKRFCLYVVVVVVVIICPFAQLCTFVNGILHYLKGHFLFTKSISVSPLLLSKGF